MGMISSWWGSKTTDEKLNAIFRGITTVLTLGGALYCVHEVKESKRILNYAVQNIGDGVEVEVSEELINDAVARSAEKQIRKAVSDVVAMKRKEIQEDTREEVEARVRDARKEITGAVSERLAKECEKIHKKDILDEIREEAAEKLSDKLDNSIDEMTSEYAKNLENMGKVYEALAEKLGKKGE